MIWLSKRVTIIIPTYNEAKNIQSIEGELNKLKGDFDVIFSDGFSTDGTFDMINYPKIQETKLRGPQMNAASRYATTEYLWFVHADSKLDPNSVIAIENSGYDAGCFRIKFDSNKLALKIGGFFSTAHRVLFRKIAFGDQGIFIKRELFNELGDYKDIPIMEDYQLSMDLKAIKKPIRLINLPIITSARRFDEGAVKTLWKMQKLQQRHRRGENIKQIHKEYEEYDGK